MDERAVGVAPDWGGWADGLGVYQRHRKYLGQFLKQRSFQDILQHASAAAAVIEVSEQLNIPDQSP